ncbi:MAG: ExbD/TolR family protein [Cytophagaceae bacterium]
MPKVKVPRKSISLDMTAMCDMAFLLLTFFMLTTKFKPDEPVVVDMPSSVSEIILPDSDVLTISVDKDGKVFLNLDGQNTRQQLVEKIAAKYKVQISSAEISKFSKMSSFGVPVGELPRLIANKDIKQPGIPMDSLNNQLKDWVFFTRRLNPEVKVAIKGDKDTSYPVIEKVIATLQEININKIKLITTMEAKPQ